MPESGLIYAAIPAIMAEIQPIAKGQCSELGYAYRGIDDVMNELQPIMAKHKVFCVPEVLEQSREERTNKKGTTLLYSLLKTKYTFYAEDGSNVSAVVIGEGMDSGDKASNKAMAVGFKYALTQTFNIPTADPKDPEIDSHEIVPMQAAKPTASPPPAVGAYKCKQCGAEVDSRVKDYSVEKYRMVLCRNCQKAKGEQR